MIILDTSGLLAAIDSSQRLHSAAAAALRSADGPLLLSPFVTPGQQIATAYDHFSLLGSLQDLFGLTRLGQAGRPGLKTFGPRVFGAYAPTDPPVDTVTP